MNLLEEKNEDKPGIKFNTGFVTKFHTEHIPLSIAGLAGVFAYTIANFHEA